MIVLMALQLGTVAYLCHPDGADGRLMVLSRKNNRKERVHDARERLRRVFLPQRVESRTEILTETAFMSGQMMKEGAVASTV